MPRDMPRKMPIAFAFAFALVIQPSGENPIFDEDSARHANCLPNARTQSFAFLLLRLRARRRDIDCCCSRFVIARHRYCVVLCCVVLLMIISCWRRSCFAVLFYSSLLAIVFIMVTNSYGIGPGEFSLKEAGIGKRSGNGTITKFNLVADKLFGDRHIMRSRSRLGCF